MRFRGSEEPVLYLSNPDGMNGEVKRDVLDTIAAINEQKLHDFGDPEIAARIAQYEMAYRMQTSVPELGNFAEELPRCWSPTDRRCASRAPLRTTA